MNFLPDLVYIRETKFGGGQISQIRPQYKSNFTRSSSLRKLQEFKKVAERYIYTKFGSFKSDLEEEIWYIATIQNEPNLVENHYVQTMYRIETNKLKEWNGGGIPAITKDRVWTSGIIVQGTLHNSKRPVLYNFNALSCTFTSSEGSKHTPNTCLQVYLLVHFIRI